MKNQESYSTQNIKHHRNIILMMTVVPLIVMVFVTAVFYSTSSRGADAQTSFRPPYDPLAIFNTPIPNNYPTDVRSSSVISKWQSVMSNNSGIFFSISGDTPAIYKSTNSDPVYTVAVGGRAYAFHAPTNMVPGTGTDGPLVVLNTDTKQELRLWRATVNNSNRTLTSEGSSLHYFNNDGSIKNPDGSRSTGKSYAGGGAGNGLSYYGGMITRGDWDSGVIRHALRIAYNNCSFTNTWRIPAIRTDQPNGCAGEYGAAGMEMGMILQLSKSINCNSRTAPTGKANDTKFVRMVCKAMQDYGIMISDGTGASAVFYMEGDATSKFSQVLTVSNGHIGGLFRNPSGTNGIPWNQFRVVSKPASYTSWGAGTPVNPSPSTPPPSPSPSPSPTPSPTGNPSSKPTAPVGVKLSPGDHKIVVTWDAAPVNQHVDTYQVYLNGSLSHTNTTSPSYTITGAPGDTYTVRVSAHNSSGYGPWTASYSGVIGASAGQPKPAPKPAPSPPPIEIPGANPTTPVVIPDKIPAESDGKIIADFNGDGLNDIAIDNNSDGKIDPTTEIVTDGNSDSALTDLNSDPIIIGDSTFPSLMSGNEAETEYANVVSLKAGPLPEVRIAKPVAYTFLIAQGTALAGIGTYLAITKLTIFAGLRGKWGL